MRSFPFTVQPGFNFLQEFGRTFGTEVYGNRLQLPASLGEGGIRMVEFSPDFRLTTHRYRLREDLLLQRRAPEQVNDLISIIFYHTDLPTGFSVRGGGARSGQYHSGIEVASGDLNADIHFPARGEIVLTVVAIRAALLKELLQDHTANQLLTTVVEPTASFFYHEVMVPEIEQQLRKLSRINEHEVLGRFYSRVQVLELLYLLFHRLAKREEQARQPVANTDMQELFAIRREILHDLSQPPSLPQLARDHHLSETRLKHLFKQVFGDTVYNYYQRARMKEAAFLLRQSDQTVSDVGYALGFSNLSHFSRLFKRYYGANPKEYELVG